MISAIALANKYYKKANKKTRDDFINIKTIPYSSMEEMLTDYMHHHKRFLSTANEIAKYLDEDAESMLNMFATRKVSHNQLQVCQRTEKSYKHILDEFIQCLFTKVCMDTAVNLCIENSNYQLSSKFKYDLWTNVQDPFAISIATPGLDQMHIGLVEPSAEGSIYYITFFAVGCDEMFLVPITTIFNIKNATTSLVYNYRIPDTNIYDTLKFNVSKIHKTDDGHAVMTMKYDTKSYIKLTNNYKGNGDAIDMILNDTALNSMGSLILACQYALEEYFFYANTVRRTKTIESHSSTERKKSNGSELHVIEPKEEFKYVPISTLAHKIYSERREWQGGTHASPYAHYRSGYERHLKDGRVVKVRGSAVGGTPEQKEAISLAVATGKPIPFYGKTKKIYVAD